MSPLPLDEQKQGAISLLLNSENHISAIVTRSYSEQYSLCVRCLLQGSIKILQVAYFVSIDLFDQVPRFQAFSGGRAALLHITDHNTATFFIPQFVGKFWSEILKDETKIFQGIFVFT